MLAYLFGGLGLQAAPVRAPYDGLSCLLET